VSGNKAVGHLLAADVLLREAAVTLRHPPTGEGRPATRRMREIDASRELAGLAQRVREVAQVLEQADS
jgi:hypothetical protein